MDNQESSPQLLIPTIPAGDCPAGNLVEVLNYIFQTYLGAATINIPGLGDVTPAEIASLQATDISLQSQIDAIRGAVRYGTGVAAAGDSTVVVTFATVLPTAQYDIHIELVDTSTGATAACSWSILSKTQAGFSLRLIDIPATITSFNYSARQII